MSDCADQSLSIEERKVLYRCRRGTRELDRILVGFFKNGYQALNEVERKTFMALLEVEDSLLIDWLCNERPVEDCQFQQLVEDIKKSRATTAGVQNRIR